MTDKEFTPLAPPLEARYLGVLPPLKLKPFQEKSSATQPEDFAKTRRREEILRLIKERFREKSLQALLAESVDGDLSVSDILSKGVFEFLDDGILLSDILPQGVKRKDSHSRWISNDKLNKDPLWEHVSAVLDTNQTSVVVVTLGAVEEFSLRFKDDKRKKAAATVIGRDNFETLGDARQVLQEGWLRVPNLGELYAPMIFKAFKK